MDFFKWNRYLGNWNNGEIEGKGKMIYLGEALMMAIGQRTKGMEKDHRLRKMVKNM